MINKNVLFALSSFIYPGDNSRNEYFNLTLAKKKNNFLKNRVVL